MQHAACTGGSLAFKSVGTTRRVFPIILAEEMSVRADYTGDFVSTCQAKFTLDLHHWCITFRNEIESSLIQY